MREIKFRAWLKNIEKMVEVEEINFIYEEVRFKDYETPFTKPIEINVSFKDVELMQYTGLKDKNGVKIFEGDIVKFDDNLYQIVYDDEDCSFVLSSKEEKHRVLGCWRTPKMEVIGNIYENKELLEE